MKNLEKHLRRGLFCESCGIADHNLLKVKFNIYSARNLPNVLIAALKDKKKLPRRYERKSAFQTITIESYKQPKTKKNT